MAAKGALFLVEVWTGSSWDQIGESRSDALAIGNESVDTTEKGDTPWRDLSACGMKTIQISGNGIMGDKTRLAVQKIKRSAFFAETLHARLTSDVTGEVSYFYGMKYIATSFNRTGEYNGAETYLFSLESASMPINSDPATGGDWDAGEDVNGDWISGYVPGFPVNGGGDGDYYFRIDTQPTNQSVLQPDAATFTCIASSSVGPISYQWKKNGVNVGTNSTTYNTGATTWAGVDDVITCVVSNGIQSVTSDNAVLNIRKITVTSLPDFPLNIVNGFGGKIGNELFAGVTTASPNNYKWASPDANWSASAGFPGPIGAVNLLHNSCPCTPDGIWFIGYMTNGPHKNYLFKTDKTWVEKLAPTSEVGGFYSSGAVKAYDPVNNKIYWIGGYSGFGTDNYDVFLRYDIAGNSWTRLTKLPFRLNNTFAVYHNGFIFVGQYSGSTTTQRLWKYDISGASWADTGITVASTTGARAVSLGGYIYIFGGNNATQTIQKYDQSNNTISTLSTSLPYAENGITLCEVIGYEVFIVGANFHFYKISF